MEVVESHQFNLQAVMDAIDMKAFGLMAAIGKIELDNFRDRASMGKRGAPSRDTSRSATFPWVIASETTAGPDIVEAEVVRRICRMCVNDGLVARVIGRRLMADGVPAANQAKRWWNGQV